MENSALIQSAVPNFRNTQTPSVSSFKKRERFEAIALASLQLNALNHGLRQQIVEHLEKEGRVTVTSLYVRFRIEQSVASQHLRILRKAKLVKTEREGKFIYYLTNKENIENALKRAGQIVGK